MHGKMCGRRLCTENHDTGAIEVIYLSYDSNSSPAIIVFSSCVLVYASFIVSFLYSDIMETSQTGKGETI